MCGLSIKQPAEKSHFRCRCSLYFCVTSYSLFCSESINNSSPGDARVRAKSEKEDKRRQMLEDDPYVTDITPHRVTCNACGTNIRLDTTYKYEGSHWRAHRARCPQIPFHERSAKRRRQEGRLLNQTHDSSRLQNDSATGESSDSYDSDASSAPRPQPTSFFTAPLEVNPTKMFLSHRTRSNQPKKDEPRDATTKEKTDSLYRDLQIIAEDLTQSGRLGEILNVASDGMASNPQEIDFFEEQVQAPSPDAAYPVFRSEHSESEPKPPASPCLDVPRMKDPEVTDAFDELFKSGMYTPRQSTDHIRMCALDKDSMSVVE